MEGARAIEAHIKAGDVVDAKYRLDEVLGIGGMGAVFAATHLELDEKVAIKFLLPQAAKDDATVKRFSREARAAAKLKSENVVRVFDVGRLESGLPYMVMERLEGRDVGQLSLERGKLDFDEAVDLVLQAIRGVAEAHASQIIHRDLKPANLFVTKRRDGSTCVKVLDFGISKTMLPDSGAGLTRTSSIIGSPEFMAPEQWLAEKDVDTRADIWAMGAILFQLVAGQPPFDGNTVAQLCTAVLHKAPAPLRKLRPDIPEGLETAILRCLQKERDARYSDLAALARAIEPFAAPQSTPIVGSIAAVLGSSVAADGGTKDAAPESVPTPPISDLSPHAVTETSLTRGATPNRRSRIGLGLGLAISAAVAIGFALLRPAPPAAQAVVPPVESAPVERVDLAPPPSIAVEAVTATPSTTLSAVTIVSVRAPERIPAAKPAVRPSAIVPSPSTAPAQRAPPPVTSAAPRSDLGGRH
jgi:serine/threonine-protein kinase